MVRFYCDRCATEVDGPDELIEVVVEGRERPNIATWSCRSEVCRTCFESVRDSIGSLFGARDDGRRNPGRRTA